MPDTLALCTLLSHMIDRDVDYPHVFREPVSRVEFATVYDESASAVSTNLHQWLLKLCCSRSRYDLIPVLTARPALRRRRIHIDETRNSVVYFEPNDDEHNARVARNVEHLTQVMAATLL